MDSPEKGKVNYSGTIPASYAPSEGVSLFSRKWWEQVSSKDAFWRDFDDKVPEDVVNKRVKQTFEIVLDIERNARKRDEKRREREAKRSQVGAGAGKPKITDESPASPHSRTASAESTITVLHTASNSSETVVCSDKVQKDSSQVNVVEKIECAKCGDFYMQAEMESGYGEALVCRKCAKVETSEEKKIPFQKSLKAETSAEQPAQATAASSAPKIEANGANVHEVNVTPCSTGQKRYSDGNMKVEGYSTEEATEVVKSGVDAVMSKKIKLESNEG
ncbi:hypothetical protein LTR41_007028 [Exophiala xenobiotica]|nr:hypothetical protein LTR41_007028 [Exophiala xenobiotica]